MMPFKDLFFCDVLCNLMHFVSGKIECRSFFEVKLNVCLVCIDDCLNSVEYVASGEVMRFKKV